MKDSIMENLNNNNIETTITNNIETNESDSIMNLNTETINENLTVTDVMVNVNLFIDKILVENAIDKKEFFKEYISYLNKEHKFVKRSSGDSSWKKKYETPYLGRGNRWLKTKDNTSDLYNKIVETIENLESDTYKEHIEREGYAWFWFQKVVGTEDNPLLRFEVRIKTSKEYHPNITFDVSQSDILNDAENLNGTPHKYQLEVDPKNRKAKGKKSKSKKNIIWKSEEIKQEVLSKREEEKEIILNTKVKATEPVEEASPEEIDNWNEFLEANDLIG